MSFRSRGHGRNRKSFPITPAQGSAFEQPSHPQLARDVHAKSPEDARRSVRKLEQDFREAKTHEKKEQIRKATQLEANRLEIGAHNHNNSVEARRSLDERRAIFQGAADRMDHDLRNEKQEAMIGS